MGCITHGANFDVFCCLHGCSFIIRDRGCAIRYVISRLPIVYRLVTESAPAMSIILVTVMSSSIGICRTVFEVKVMHVHIYFRDIGICWKTYFRMKIYLALIIFGIVSSSKVDMLAMLKRVSVVQRSRYIATVKFPIFSSSTSRG